MRKNSKSFLLLSYLRTQYILKKKLLLRWLGWRKHTSYERFIILCGPRTGSTLLHTYLNAHPNIISYGEILRRSFENGVPLTYNRLFIPQAGFVRAAGPKVFYEYYATPGYKNVFNALLSDKALKVLHITRQNLMRLFVSYKIAEKTGVWNDMRQPGEVDKQIYVDPHEFRSFCKTYQEQVTAFRHLFSGHRIHELTYEELTGMPEETLQAVQEFLGVPQRRLFTILQKQNPEPLETLVVNYREIQELM